MGKKLIKMFIGRYYHTIEAKGRISLPKKFREKEQQTLIVTRGFDGGLYVFPQETWLKEVATLATRTFTKKDHRDIVRLMTNDAQEVEIDHIGRILIPEYLRQYAHLEKQAVIVGSFNKIEIWDADTYHTYIEKTEQLAEEIAEHIEPSEQ